MLYLPPSHAHDGVALDACTTYSVGFRAATHTELAQAFLDHLRDRICIPGRYEDPGLRPAREPARIDAPMQRRAARALAQIRWSAADVARSLRAFTAAVRRKGMRLDRHAQWLFDDDALYVNGEARPWPRHARAALTALANARSLSAAQAKALADDALAILHEDYRHGSLHIG
jgi:50S ribosomal protein L16 3-hydroxylase